MSIFVFEICLESFPPLPSVAFSPIQARHMLFNVLAASQKVLSSACPQGWEILTNGFNSKVERTSKPLIYRWSWEFWMLLFSIWQNRGLARDNGQGYRSYCLLGQNPCWPFHTRRCIAGAACLWGGITACPFSQLRKQTLMWCAHGFISKKSKTGIHTPVSGLKLCSCPPSTSNFLSHIVIFCGLEGMAKTWMQIIKTSLWNLVTGENKRGNLFGHKG